ncbi:MAG: M48 family metallopeptidase, partial [Planctomycetota bacterium]|nr:M48 family metallopeptidase [Planctomycetota bacterium]
MWEQIRSNRRRSGFVLVGMGTLLIAIGMALGAVFAPNEGGLIFGGIGALVVWFVLFMVTVGGGDDIMLRMAGAREIEHRHHPVLFNIVEEMTIAAALPNRPRVFVVDDPSPNAFAVGRDPRKASVAVTTGLLKILDRDELQGVVAHEIGHIKNRDVALLTTAGVMMGAIVLLSELGLRAFWYSGGGRRSRSSSDKGGGQAVIMLVAIVLLLLSPLLAQLMYFALSRRREYLADASGAMFSRYPEGLASALEKLGGGGRPPLTDRSKVTAPMYIVAPLRASGGGGSLLSTHPPLGERVRILRAMGTRADVKAYDAAYQRVRGRRIVGVHTLEAAEETSVRPPEHDEAGADNPLREVLGGVLGAVAATEAAPA